MTEKIKKEFQLCSDRSCCPVLKFVEKDGRELVIIQDDTGGKVELSSEQWQLLKNLISQKQI